jgi:N-acetyl-anhydromuramyl-L-alanine amidase AmpD
MTGATEFFEQLEQFTALWVRDHIGGIEPHSPWYSEEWSYGEPNGAVIHYTADPDPRRVMRWFLMQSHNARCSAHAVVLPRWTDELRELADGFSAIKTLSAPILQAVEPNREAWHATWANSWAYGIENVNVGQLQCRSGHFFWWRPRNRSAADWTSKWDVTDGEPIPLLGRWWTPYPREQICANVELLQKVDEYFDGSLRERTRIVGHEQVQQNKRDPGPAYPMHALRQALFNKDYFALDQHAEDLIYGQSWRDSKVCQWYELASPQKAWFKFSEDVHSRTVVRNQWELWGLLLLIMELLGYSMGASSGDLSYRLFQRCMGLEADGIVGPLTWRALKERLRDRKMIK